MKSSIKKLKFFPVTLAKAVYISKKTPLDDYLNLRGKTWTAIGDSITAGNGGTPYQTVIGDKWDMKVTTLGYSGATVSGTTGVISLNGIADKTDYITFWGGVNDFKSGAVTLGDMSSDKSNRNTFYGALHYICRLLIKTYPNAKIGFITPMKFVFEGFDETNQTNSKGETLEQYVNAIKEVCGYYGIPVLDLYNENNMNPYITEIKNAYYADGLHPNSKGYIRLSNKIEKFLISL